MASYTDIIPKFNPYISQLPVQAMVEVGMEKQRRYDEGIQKIQTSIENIAGLEIMKDPSKKYLQSKLNELGSKLKTFAASDFSNFQLVNSVSGMTKQLVKDPTIQNAVASTQLIKKGQADMEAAIKEGKSSPNREWDFMNEVNNYLNDGDAASKFNGRYKQHIDVNKKSLEIIQKLHPNAKVLDNPYVVNADGSVNYKEVASAMRKSGIKEVSEAQIRTAVNSMLDANDLDELASQGRYNYRNYTTEDLQAAATRNYDATRKSYETSLKQLQSQLAATTDLEQQAELNKSITYYKQQLGEDGDPGELAKNFKTTLELIPQNLNGARAQLYTKNWLDQLSNGFAYREVSDEIVASPARADWWKIKEYDFNVLKEKNDQYWKEKQYNLEVDKLELEKQKAAAEAAGTDPYWNPSGNPTIDAINAMSNWAGKQQSLVQENQNLLSEIANNTPAVDGVSTTPRDVLNNINNYRLGKYQPRNAYEKSLMDKYIITESDLSNQEAVYKQKEKEVYKEMGLDFNKTLTNQLSGINGLTITLPNGTKTTFTPREIYEYTKKEKSKAVGKADGIQLSIDPETLTEREKILYNSLRQRYQGLGYGSAKSTGNSDIDNVINRVSNVAATNAQVDSEVKRRLAIKLAPITGAFSKQQAAVTFKDGTDKSNFVSRLTNIVQSDLSQKTGAENYKPADVLESLTKSSLDNIDFQVGRQGDSYVIQVTDKASKTTSSIPVTAEFIATTPNLGRKWLSPNLQLSDRVLRNGGSTNLTGNFKDAQYPVGLFGGTVQGQRTVTLPVAADFTYEGGQVYPLFRLMTKNGQITLPWPEPTDPTSFKDVYLPSLNNDKILKLFKTKYPNIEQLISQ